MAPRSSLISSSDLGICRTWPKRSDAALDKKPINERLFRDIVISFCEEVDEQEKGFLRVRIDTWSIIRKVYRLAILRVGEQQPVAPKPALALDQQVEQLRAA